MVAKSTKAILFASLVGAMILPLGVLNNASASHPLPETELFDDINQSVCYQLTLLNQVKINGQTNNSALIKAEVEKARKHISGKTDMTISYDSICNSYDNEIRSKYFNSLWTHADTVSYFTGSDNHYKWISFTSHSWHNFIDSGACNWWESENIKFVANHEFGHFAGLGHASNADSDSHTMMKRDCTPGFAVIKPADINQINGMYQS